MAISYTREFWDRICLERKIVNPSYTPNANKKPKHGPTPRDMNRETKVSGDCQGENCERRFEKAFRRLVELFESGELMLCETCSKKVGNEKREKTNLAIHGVKHIGQSEDVKVKSKATCLAKYGNEHAIASDSVRLQNLETLQQKYGANVTNVSQIAQVQETKKQHRLDADDIKYNNAYLDELLSKDGATRLTQVSDLQLTRQHDIEYVCRCGRSHSKSFKAIEKSGAFCEGCQHEHAMLRTNATNMERRNVPWVSLDPSVIQAAQETNLATYGFKSAAQSEEVKEKMRNTNMELRGVPYPKMSAQVRQTARENLLSKSQVKYVKSYLEELLQKDEAVCLETIDDLCLSRESFIHFECKCHRQHVQTFRSIEMYGAQCGGCRARINKNEEECREIFERVCKEIFGCESPFLRVRSIFSNGHMELDGYCEELDIAFEYQGEPHYHYIPFFHRNGEDDLKAQWTRDEQKRKECKELGIYLIEVPYWIESKEEYIRESLSVFSSLNI